MRRLLLVVLAAALAAPTLPAAAQDRPGRIGPSLALTGNGRKLDPAGRLTELGNFPSGSALSPDGRFMWAVDSGHGANDVKVVELSTGKVAQTLPLPGGYGGVAFAPDGRRAYVSGEAKSTAKPPPPGGPTKGDQGDVIHVFDVDPASGAAKELDPIALPSTSGGSGQMNSLPPTSKSWPEGLDVSPDGKTLVVALNQADKAAVIDTVSRAVRLVSVGRYPFGAAVDPDGKVAYVSNEQDGTVSVIDLASARQVDTIGVGGGKGNNFAHPEDLLVDPTRGLLYVAVASRDLVAVVDTKTRKVTRSVSVARDTPLGTQPVGLGLAPDGSRLYVADSNEDALAVISLGATSAAPHPVIRPRTPPYVLVRSRRAKSARSKLLRGLARRACAGPTAAQEARYLRVAYAAARKRDRTLRSTRSPKTRRAAMRRYTRVAGAAFRRLPARKACAAPDPGGFRLIGRIPTAAYPTDVEVGKDGTVAWIAGKGLGSGPNPGFAFDGVKTPTGNVETPYGEYIPDKLIGRAGVLPTPDTDALAKLTERADRQVLPANTVGTPPAGTPLRAGGPIKHVFYVVRENRTYDQVFGSDKRGDGDPSLELFDDNGVAGSTGGVTPNVHKLTRTYPLLDHFYANSEVSIDGHIITASAFANDYVQRALHPNYSGRGRAFDFGVFPITFPPNGFVFDQAVRQGVSFRDYGEQAAGNLPGIGNDGRPTYSTVVANTDQAYAGNVQIGCLSGPATPAQCTRDSGLTVNPLGTPAIGGASRLDVFASEFRQQVAGNGVPAFNYMILPNDHTNGTSPGGLTPKALVADNDLALGQLVDLISHSSVWDSSAIVVVEDDSQDGADHVDAHRMPALVISPWARTDGAVVSTRYDQYSALRTAEMLAGLQPLGLNDALATPMYDAFRTDGKPDARPYDAVRPAQALTETNPSGGANARLSRAMPFSAPDLVPQAILDRILWRSVHGADSTPPPPGPNASAEEHERATTALRMLRSGASPRRYLERTGGEEGEAGGG